MYCYCKGNSLLVSPVGERVKPVHSIDLGITHYPSLGKGDEAGSFGSRIWFSGRKGGGSVVADGV